MNRTQRSPDRWWARVAALVAAAASPTARAAQPPELLPPPPAAAGAVRVRWQAPPGTCPTEAAIQARVDGLLGDAAQGLDAAASVQQLAVAAREGAWRLDLRLRWAGGSDQRVLHARDCAALADATVVLVVVLAAPLAAAPRFTASGPAVSGPDVSGPPAPVVISTEAPVEGPVIAPSSIAPVIASARSGDEATLERAAPGPGPGPERAPRRRGAFARVTGVAGYGALPGGDFGVAVAAGGLLRRVRLEGVATVLPARARQLGDGTGGAVALATAAARACPRFLGPTLELSLCAGVEVGASWSRSLGVAPAGRSAGPWLAFALGGALGWWFSPQVGLHVGVDALAAPVVTRYLLGDRELYGPRRVLVRGTVGLVFVLGARVRS